MSQALGKLAGSQQMLQYMQQQAQVDVMAAILKVWHHIKNQTPSIDAYLFEVQSCQTTKWHPAPIRNDGALGLFWRGRHKKKNNNQTSIVVGSVFDPKMYWSHCNTL